MKTTSNHAAIPVTISCLGLAITIGCNPQSRDRLMHFFFEVPAENTVPTAATPLTDASAPVVPTPFTLPVERFAAVHSPVLTRECDACHDAANQMEPHEDLASACRTCHTEFAALEEGHAPAVAGECATCHEMHRSHLVGLLRQPVFDLCVGCHDAPDYLSEQAHGVANVERCTHCHDPHFGEGALLKPEYEKSLPNAIGE